MDPPSQPRRPLSTTAAVAIISGATYVSLALGLLRGILYTRCLPSPTSRGIVQIVFIFTTYLSFSQLGIIQGITKRVPFLLGRSDEEEVERVERAGITSVFLLGLVAATFMWLYAAVNVGLGVKTRYALAIGGVYLVFMQLSSAYRIVLRAHQHFGWIARATIFEAFLLLALVVGGSQLFDAPGTMLGWALGLAVVCVYWLSLGIVPAMPKIDLGATLGLVKLGLPLLGVALCERFLRTADQLVVAKVLGAQMLGYYGVASQLSAYLYNLPGAAGEVVTPRILQAYGEDRGEAMRHAVLDMTTALSLLMPPLAGIAAILGPVLVRIVLPRYIPAIPPLEVLLMAVVCLAVPTALRPTLIARNREWEMMLCQVLSGLLGGGIVLWLTTRDAPLQHLAVGAGAGWLVGGAAVTWRGLAMVGISGNQALRTMLGLAWPFAYCTGLIGLLKSGWLSVNLWGSPVWSELLALPFFLVLTAPLVVLAERRTSILARIRAGRAAREEPIDLGEEPLE